MSRIQHLARSPYGVLSGYAALAVALFGGVLSHEFSVVDDLHGIVENAGLLSLKANIASGMLGQIIPSLLITLFGMTPVPFHILAICAHILCGYCTYRLALRAGIQPLYACAAGALFIIHPINTEAINWISALMYICSTLTILLLVWNHMICLETPSLKRFVLQCVIYALFIIMIRNAWVLTLIPIMYVFERYIASKAPSNQRSMRSRLYISYSIGLLIFLLILFPQIAIGRISSQPHSSAQIQVNQQALAPVLQGYPYSLYRMTVGYLFPPLLTIYDDGIPISTIDMVFFYIVTVLYGLVIFISALRKKNVLLGYLLILPICIAPVFSPYKVTWFFAERYAYIGTPFYAMCALYLLQTTIHRRFGNGRKLLLILIYFAALSFRSAMRNAQWQTPETLAHATIASSPKSIRAYNDVAGYYFLKNRIPESKRAFAQTLTIGPSLVAMENLGLIYSKHGFDTSIHTTTASYAHLMRDIQGYLKLKEYRLALYYINEARAVRPNDPQLPIYATEACIELQAWHCAESELVHASDLKARMTDIYFLRGFLNFQTHHESDAKRDLIRLLSLDPTYPGAYENLRYIQSH